jgi:hypothetical protein
MSGIEASDADDLSFDIHSQLSYCFPISAIVLSSTRHTVALLLRLFEHWVAF